MSRSSMRSSVFVGNIPYDATEEELRQFFSVVGPVVSLRIVYDRETGKSKGFGFCEFADAETALSAIRNLGHQEFHGRQLKVDFADAETRTADRGGDREPRRDGRTAAGAGGKPAAAILPGAPVQPTGGAELSGPEAVAQKVSSMSPEKLYATLAVMKVFIQTAPDEARALLQNNVALAHALWQMQIALGMMASAQVPGLLPVAAAAVPPTAAAAVAPLPAPVLPAVVAPLVAAAVAPAPVVAPPPAAAAAAGSMSALVTALLTMQGSAEQKQALLQQLMALTPQQIEAIPDPAQRAQLQALQAQMAQLQQLQGYR